MTDRPAVRHDSDDPRAEDEWSDLAASGARAGGEITIRRLRAFWAIAHAESLTRAAKTLGIAQPTLSQQLTGLESALGIRLFERRSNRLELTETGAWLLRKSEAVLRGMQELEDGLAGGLARRTVRIAGVTSPVRALLPATMQALETAYPTTEYDLQELAPAEILDLLYARRINVGLLSASSVAEVSAGFWQESILEDPHVLAVPRALDLAGVRDPSRDMDPAAAAILHATIQFVFGSQHTRRVQDWYDRFLPMNRLRARVRSFELALGLVRAELGICIVPALSVLTDPGGGEGVRLYRIDMEPRRIVTMIPSQYRRTEPYPDLVAALREAGRGLAMPLIEAAPPFIAASQEPARSLVPAP